MQCTTMAAGKYPNVLEKVKRHEAYSKYPEDKQRELAHALTDRNLLFSRFECLLYAVEQEVQAAIDDNEATFTHSLELQSAHQRAKHGAARLCHLPVKLFLSRLQRLNLPTSATISITSKLSGVLLEFGALHAGLMVGDVRVEWSCDSLINPQWEDPQFVEEDFVAHVHQDGKWALAASNYNKRISLADRERRIQDKIELLLESAEEKQKLIMNLVEVIVRYNCTKEYGVVNCNCQHFVDDALHALGIDSIPVFSGPLNEYLQNLKRYQVDVPDEFRDHAALDAYVQPKLAADTLTQHHMEYLLLHYYRLHINSLSEDDDIDEWECEVPSCQYEFIAEKVNSQAMMCHQFLRQRTQNSITTRKQRPTNLHTIPETGESANHTHTGITNASTVAQPTRMSTNGPSNGVNDGQPVAAAPTPEDDPLQKDHKMAQNSTNGPSNGVNDGQPVAAAAPTPEDDPLQKDHKMAQNIAKGDQEVAIQTHTPKGYYSRVMAKLRVMPEYTEKPDGELHDLVEALTEVESFRAKYECFRAIVETPIETLTMELSIDKDLVDRTQLQQSVATNKVAERYERVCKFPVKLVLRVKSSQCGSSVSDASLHAALLISDHLFEWDERSLVIPKKVDFTKQPTLTTRILHGSEWFTYVIQKRSRLDEVLTSPPGALHENEVDLMFELTTKKDDLIKSVIKSVTDYNRHKQYHKKSCNNRHFIQDVTGALGVKKLPAFGASLKQQLEKSKRQCSRKLSRANLTTHENLDVCVSGLGEEELYELAVVDLEYLVGKYFFFHVEQWEQSQAPDQWTCQQRNCQLTKVEEQLERTALSSQSNCVLL